MSYCCCPHYSQFRTEVGVVPLFEQRNGVAQGCLAIEWLFAMAFVRRCGCCNAVRIDGLLRAGAHDVTAACRGAETIVRMDPVMADIEAATGLGMHPTKTKIVPAVSQESASPRRPPPSAHAESAPRFAPVWLRLGRCASWGSFSGA